MLYSKSTDVKGGEGGVDPIALNTQSYGASPAIWDHTVLAAT